jgi:hypothetical protein
MSARLDAIRDMQDAGLFVPSLEDIKAKAKKQACRLLSLWKQRNRNVTTIRLCAEQLGIGDWQIRRLVRENLIWSALECFTSKTNRRYRARIVDVDEVKRAWREVQEQDAKRQEAAPKCEQPPTDLVPIRQMRRELGVGENTLGQWIRRGDLPAQRITVHASRRNGPQWFVDRNVAIAVFKQKRAARHGKNMRRDETVPITPLIRELWGIVETHPDVSAFWRQEQ